jgi:TolB-like protein/thioredoxin-like negative regulator of GroEL
MSLIGELKRRNVLRAGAAYVALAWLVVQVVETLFPLFGLSDAAARTVVIVLAVGFVPAIIAAWAFELTPEGLKRESEVDHDSAASRTMTRRLDRLIMVLLALGLAYFAFDKFVLDPGRDEAREAEIAEQARREGRTEAIVESYGDKSIAVLPFVNMSADPEQEYFADGISEELLNLLARIPELRVISRSSAFAFKGKDVEIPVIAERLNVAHVLEGSVRKAGNRIRITAQLIEARSDTHLWSATYDRTLDDIFAIQDEVAEEVVASLHLQLLGEAPTAKREDPRAYSLAIQARQIMALQRFDEYPKAEGLLREALEIDPEYVDARVLLLLLTMDQMRVSPPEKRAELFPRVEALTSQVLEQDPDNPRLKAVFALQADDPGTAARMITEAVRTDPFDPFVLFQAARVAGRLGKLDLAIRLGEYVAERDPLFFWAQLNLAQYYFDAGRVEDSLQRFETAVRLNPTAGAIQWKLGLARLMMGDPEGALAAFEQEEERVYRLHGLALAYHDLGRDQESYDAMEKLLPTETEAWPFGLARAYAWMGDADKAFHFLEATAASEPGYLSGMAFNPLLNKLHDDPRWMPFLESVGQSPEQLAAIELDVALPGDAPRTR